MRSGMYRAQKFAENCYYHELAKGLRGLGYEIVNDGRSFEIKGVPASVIALFSKRHQQIDAETKSESSARDCGATSRTCASRSPATKGSGK
jgi:conjugative relaxase-like TrwC/TraI family protein